MGGAVGLVIPPTIAIGIAPLRRIDREIINSLCAEALVIPPTVSVGVQPLRGLEREGIGAVLDGPVFITVGEGVHIGVNATVAVCCGEASDERASIGLSRIVNKLPDAPKQASVVEGSVIPIIAETVLIGVVPL